MKKILAMAAVAALAAGASVYAANPFSDVSTSDWAYQAVADLSDQGVVEGYPDGTFKGENNITRYEMAQIIARLMAKEDQLNAEQRATVDKLAGEYADELDNLGVRVSNLEKKVGNIAWSGDARLRYSAKNDDTDSYTARIRINARATVNDNTYAHLRLTTGNTDLKGGADADVVADRVYVHHDFGDKVGVTAGKYEVDAGNGTLNTWLVSQTFDGAEAQFKLGDVALKAGYGRFNPEGTNAAYSEADKDKVTGDLLGTYSLNYSDYEFFYAQAKADLKVATLGVDYFKSSDDVAVHYTDATTGEVTTAGYGKDAFDYEVVGANLAVPFGAFSVFGDYYVNTKGEGTPTVWNAGVGYKAPAFSAAVAYFDVSDADKGLVYIPGLTGWQVNEEFLYNNGSFLYAAADVPLAKGVSLHGEYAFASDVDAANTPDLDDSWTVSLNYKF